MNVYAFVAAMSPTSLLRTGAAIVAFLAILFWDRRADTWIRANVLLAAFAGFMGYFIPASSGNLVGATLPVHEYLIQVLGALSLAGAYCLYHLSTDGATRVLIYLAQAVAAAAVLIVRVYGELKYRNNPVHFDEEHLSLGIPIIVMLMIGSLVVLYRHGDGAGGGDGGRVMVIAKGGINTHLIIDGFFYVLFGAAFLAYPDLSLNMMEGVTPDGMMATIIRNVGVVYLVSGMFSFFFCVLSNTRDKRVKLLERLLVAGLYLPMVTLYQLKYQFVPYSTFAVGIGLSLVPAANAACALYIRKSKRL